MGLAGLGTPGRLSKRNFDQRGLIPGYLSAELRRATPVHEYSKYLPLEQEDKTAVVACPTQRGNANSVKPMPGR